MEANYSLGNYTDTFEFHWTESYGERGDAQSEPVDAAPPNAPPSASYQQCCSSRSPRVTEEEVASMRRCVEGHARRDLGPAFTSTTITTATAMQIVDADRSGAVEHVELPSLPPLFVPSLFWEGRKGAKEALSALMDCSV